MIIYIILSLNASNDDNNNIAMSNIILWFFSSNQSARRAYLPREPEESAKPLSRGRPKNIKFNLQKLRNNR